MGRPLIVSERTWEVIIKEPTIMGGLKKTPRGANKLEAGSKKYVSANRTKNKTTKKTKGYFPERKRGENATHWLRGHEQGAVSSGTVRGDAKENSGKHVINPGRTSFAPGDRGR